MSEIGTDQTVDPLARFWGTLCQMGVIKIFLFVAVAVNLYHAASARSTRQSQQDFAHYYASSKVWLDGEQVYKTDLRDVYKRLGWQGFDEEIYQATNPPALVAAFAPFASLSPKAAYMAWMLVQILCLIIAIWLTWTCLSQRISFDAFAFVLAIYLFLPFVSSHLFYSQVQLLVLALVLGAYRLTIASEEYSPDGVRYGSFVACVLIAIASLIKIFPVVLLPWFVWQSHKRFVDRVVAGLIAGAVLALGVQFLGWEIWMDFVQNGLPTVSTWIKAGYECFTFGNAFHQIAVGFGGDPTSDLYVRVGGILGAIVLSIFYLRLIFRSEQQTECRHVEFGLLVLLMLFCGGTCWWHYLVFLLFPFQVIAAETRDRLTMAILCSSGFVLLLFANIQLPKANTAILNAVMNQRPLIGMVMMALFLAWILNRIPHSGSQNAKMENPTIAKS